MLIAEIILPVAIPSTYTYYIPAEFEQKVQVGIRVEVPFGKNKLYSGIILEIKKAFRHERQLKPILDILDLAPIVNPAQLELWKWMAEYYMANLGEVMLAALPGALKLSSESYLALRPNIDWTKIEMSDEAYLLCEAMDIQQRLSLSDLHAILQGKKVMKTALSLVEKGVAFWVEELEQKFKAKKQDFIRIHPQYDVHQLSDIFELTKKSPKQTRVLLYLLQNKNSSPWIAKRKVCAEAQVDPSVIQALHGKGIIELVQGDDPRIDSSPYTKTSLSEATRFQQKAIAEIHEHFKKSSICLLHGVAGSGKTRVYQDLINHYLENGQQVLYLLPEISLSTQMENRLKKLYGQSLISYHSRIHGQKKVEIWHSVLHGHPMVLSARSGIFLPFKNLGLIIVDEEHDPSYKQQDPAPYYNARDTAIYLSKLYGCKVLLGSATPSIESYKNALEGKYGLVTMSDRFGDGQLPKVELISIPEASQRDRLFGIFTDALLEEIKNTLQSKKKVILFQNRRGYAPIVQCKLCGWKAECESCDISLTFHQHNQTLKCHYCNKSIPKPKACPKCRSQQLVFKGFGTEKIEDELPAFIADARISRFDADSTSSGKNLQQILDQFESGEINILIGTQMVTKGLDFEDVGLTGIILADQMIHFPDFRASERAFQLMVQVAGRAGRKGATGKVLIQTYQKDHPLLSDISRHQYASFYERELNERKQFAYPPFTKLIEIKIKHKDLLTCRSAAYYLAENLKTNFGNRIIGPATPNVSRIKNLYIEHILIKMEKNVQLITNVKNKLLELKSGLSSQKGMSAVRLIINVDPY